MARALFVFQYRPLSSVIPPHIADFVRAMNEKPAVTWLEIWECLG